MRGTFKGTLYLFDQLVFGSSTLITLLLLNRFADASAAGHFSLALLPSIVASAVAQGLLVDASVLNAHRVDSLGFETGRLAVTLGLAFVPASLLISFAFDAPLVTAVAVGLLTPVVISQFVRRALYLAEGRVATALVSDSLWVLPLVLAGVAATFSDRLSHLGEDLILFAWSTGSILAIISFGSFSGFRPHAPKNLLQHSRRHHALGWELLFGQGISQGTSLLMATISSAAVVGLFRTAQTLTTPLLLVASAVRNPLFAKFVRDSGPAADDAGDSSRRCLTYVALAVTGGVLLAGLVKAIPDEVLRVFLGVDGPQIADIATVLCLDVGLASGSLICSLLLRARGRTSMAIKLRVVNAVAAGATALSLLLAYGSASSAAIGLLVADAVMLCAWTIVATSVGTQR